MSKYPTDISLLPIIDIYSCWMQIPITTFTKRLKKRDKKDLIYSDMLSSQIQLVSQRSNPLYNGKGTHKAKYQLLVTHYIQMFHWKQHLITHSDLKTNLMLIVINFLPCLSLYLICFCLFHHILNFTNPWLSSLNQMQTFNKNNWSPQYLTKNQLF